MKYIKGTDREQVILFPEVIDDYIAEENPVRFIDAFVEGLNLKELGFKHGWAKLYRQTLHIIPQIYWNSIFTVT